MSEGTGICAVLCWDIDGTLLTTARAGVYALEKAAQETCGRQADLSQLSTAGLTDAQVAALVIEACGVSSSASRVGEFLRAYERHLPETLGWKKGFVLDGVIPVLDVISTMDSIASILLTGNTEAGAKAKLSHYGLDRYFNSGSYCEGPGNRISIARRAQRMARTIAGPNLSEDRLYVIGDTTHDVRCGQAVGARTVAVASGPVSGHGLREAEPWLLLPKIPDPGTFLELLGLYPSGRVRSGRAG